MSFFHTALNQVSTHFEYERVNFDNLVKITFLFIAINHLLLSLCTIQWKSNPNEWAKKIAILAFKLVVLCSELHQFCDCVGNFGY